MSLNFNTKQREYIFYLEICDAENVIIRRLDLSWVWLDPPTHKIERRPTDFKFWGKIMTAACRKTSCKHFQELSDCKLTPRGPRRQLAGSKFKKVSLVTQVNERHIKNCNSPSWLRGKESTYQCRRYEFNPWSGKIPHAAEQITPWTTTIRSVQ